MNIRIGISALQGAFAEHREMFESLGAEVFELRCRQDLMRHYDALVLPGGESTVQGKLLRELQMFEPLKASIANGMPVMATCAGIILLAEKIADDPTVHFGTLPVTVRRNAYGRQLSSFFTDGDFAGQPDIPMPFIRAPQITGISDQVEILSGFRQIPTAVRFKNQLAMTFHPEITQCRKIHSFFLEKIVIGQTKI